MTQEREDRLASTLSTKTCGFTLQKDTAGLYSISHPAVPESDFPRWRNLTLSQVEAIVDDLVASERHNKLAEAFPQLAHHLRGPQVGPSGGKPAGKRK